VSQVFTLRSPRLVLGDQLVADGWVTVADDGTVAAAGDTTTAPPTGSVITLPTGVLAPGLVDAQCNGAFGVDLVDADTASWQRVLGSLPATGVTAVVPTFITAPVDTLAAALRRPRGPAEASPADGHARDLGVHLEGPFLAEGRRGAHDAAFLTDPVAAAVDDLLEAAGDDLLYVTLAPEREGAIEAIRRLTAAGVRVAIGHSDATDEQATAAVDAGATLVTHLFNAQSPLAHRAPGVVGVALSDPRLTVGLIADLYHVAPTAIRVAFAAASDRLMLVTDAVAAMGMPPGTYVLGGAEVTVADGAPPLRDDGAIAGSALRLDEAVGNVVRCGIDPVEALLAATRVPADALGRPDLGRIVPGVPADLVWLDDDWHTSATWIDGRVAFGDDALAALS
jgi:N-acetylglucosamine-6-phosphate deacetylase